jgi:hypothetical protein
MKKDASHPFQNDETYDAAKAFGVDLSADAPTPEWLLHLDQIKTQEKEQRPKVTPHADSTAERARDFALHLGIPTDEAERLRVALVWHDVGKIFIPDAIFFAGKFTDAEMEVMKSHAERGANLLASVEGMPQIFVDLARLHHERYDGNGYEGLKGEDIPYLARIAQICDVYDARTEPRHYRDETEPNPPHLALAVTIAPYKGPAQFDPYLIREFVRHQLQTVLVGEPEERLESFRAFAATDPMDDLRHLGPDAGVCILANGRRTIFDKGEDGTPRVTGFLDRTGRDVMVPIVDPVLTSTVNHRI